MKNINNSSNEAEYPKLILEFYPGLKNYKSKILGYRWIYKTINEASTVPVVDDTSRSSITTIKWQIQ